MRSTALAVERKDDKVRIQRTEMKQQQGRQSRTLRSKYGPDLFRIYHPGIIGRSSRQLITYSDWQRAAILDRKVFPAVGGGMMGDWQ